MNRAEVPSPLSEREQDKRIPISRRINDYLDQKWDEYVWPLASHLMYLRLMHYRHIGKTADIQPGQKVLEIGSGYPGWKMYSHQVGKEGLFVALDINKNIQRRSQKIGKVIDRLSKREQSSDVLVVADSQKLPFADNSFDTVIAANVTGTYQDGYIPEAERILKNGGRLIVSFTEPFMSRSFAKNSSQQCQEAGFDSVDIRRGSMATLLPGVVVNNYVIARKTSHFRGSGKNWRWL